MVNNGEHVGKHSCYFVGNLTSTPGPGFSQIRWPTRGTTRNAVPMNLVSADPVGNDALMKRCGFETSCLYLGREEELVNPIYSSSLTRSSMFSLSSNHDSIPPFGAVINCCLFLIAKQLANAMRWGTSN